MATERAAGSSLKSWNSLPYTIMKVVSPDRIRIAWRNVWEARDGKVVRGEAVETVYETVVGEGRKVLKCGLEVSIDADSGSCLHGSSSDSRCFSISN